MADENIRVAVRVRPFISFSTLQFFVICHLPAVFISKAVHGARVSNQTPYVSHLLNISLSAPCCCSSGMHGGSIYFFVYSC